MKIASVIALIASCAQSSDAFTHHIPSTKRRISSSSLCMSSSSESASTKSMVVVSPPGGVGESTAVKAATMGSSVRWFVISDPSVSTKVSLSQETLAAISSAGGKVELAGADAQNILLPKEEEQSAISSVSQWCGTADSLVCTFDGVEKAIRSEDDKEDPTERWMDSIKLAAQEAGRSIRGAKIAILPTLDDEVEEASDQGNLFSSILGGKKVVIPNSLTGAMSADVSKVVKLRHGELFGIPESSVRV